MPVIRKQTEIIIAERREKIAAFYVQRVTQQEIARRLSVSQATVSYDLAAIQEVWLASSLCDLNKRKAEELARIDRVEAEAWAAWEKSKRDAETMTAETIDTPDGPRTKKHKRIEGQSGDPRFLAVVVDCVDRRLKILGIIKPGDTNVSLVNINWDDLTTRKPRADPIELRISDVANTPSAEAPS